MLLHLLATLIWWARGSKGMANMCMHVKHERREQGPTSHLLPPQRLFQILIDSTSNCWPSLVAFMFEQRLNLIDFFPTPFPKSNRTRQFQRHSEWPQSTSFIVVLLHAESTKRDHHYFCKFSWACWIRSEGKKEEKELLSLSSRPGQSQFHTLTPFTFFTLITRGTSLVVPDSSGREFY